MTTILRAMSALFSAVCLIGTFALVSVPAPAHAGAYGGLTLGGESVNGKIEGWGESDETGLTGSVRLGYTAEAGGFFFGGEGFAAFHNTEGDVLTSGEYSILGRDVVISNGAIALKAENSFGLTLRGGKNITANHSIYGLAGIEWISLKLDGSISGSIDAGESNEVIFTNATASEAAEFIGIPDDERIQGFHLGLGYEYRFDDSKWGIGGEYRWSTFSDEWGNSGVDVDLDSHQFQTALRYYLN